MDVFVPTLENSNDLRSLVESEKLSLNFEGRDLTALPTSFRPRPVGSKSFIEETPSYFWAVLALIALVLVGLAFLVYRRTTRNKAVGMVETTPPMMDPSAGTRPRFGTNNFGPEREEESLEFGHVKRTNPIFGGLVESVRKLSKRGSKRDSRRKGAAPKIQVSEPDGDDDLIHSLTVKPTGFMASAKSAMRKLSGRRSSRRKEDDNASSFRLGDLRGGSKRRSKNSRRRETFGFSENDSFQLGPRNSVRPTKVTEWLVTLTHSSRLSNLRRHH